MLFPDAHERNEAMGNPVRDSQRRIVTGVLMMSLVSACGGGAGGNSAVTVPPPVAGLQSPGGIWFGFDSTGEPVSLFISENGMVLAALQPAGALLPSHGGGTVGVSDNSVLGGAFELAGPLQPASFIRDEDLACSLDGTVSERQSMSVDIVCSDANGVVYDEALSMRYDDSYERPTSLDALAGDYTLDFQTSSNSLTVSADGTLSGMYHNGARCLVNGAASLIDENFTLIGVSWTMSNCTDLFGICEGVRMTGFAMQNLEPGGNPDVYYFGLTGSTVDGLFTVSVLYEPL